jgi:hypothetical protein
MGALERLVLRVADWDGTWWGLGWLRPAKHHRVGVGRLVLIRLVLSVPGVAVGLGLIYLGARRLDPSLCLAVFAGLMLVQVCLNVPWAYFWNRRAAALSSQAGDES